MESLQIFDNFKLNDLDDEWVKSVWEAQFLTCTTPPHDYLLFIESNDMGLLLKETRNVVQDWTAELGSTVENGEENSEVSWHTLIVSNLNVHALLAVLYYIIKNGQDENANENAKHSCLKAASLYLTLLTIPGSNVFNVFHENLYQKVLDTLKFCEYLFPMIKRKNMLTNLKSWDISNDATNNCMLSFSKRERIALTKGLYNVLCDFIAMIKLFSLKDYPQSLESTVYALIEVTTVKTDINLFNVDRRTNTDIVISICKNAYTALQELCNTRHGPIDLTIMLITKYAYPRFMFNYTDLPMKIVANMRDSTIHFLKILSITHEKATKEATITLIQQLMVNCPEKMEARQKQIAILLKLIVCKEEILIQAITDIITFSYHSKISCRLFAQEMIGKVLTEPCQVSSDLSDSFRWTNMKKILIAAVLSRCMDCSSMVRGKAMATIAEFTNLESNIEIMIKGSTYEVTESIDEAFVSYNELKEAVIKNVAPTQNLNNIIKILMDRVEDKRALVRRSALQILKNLTIRFPSMIEKIAPIVSRRCRDPTITVRCFAIHVLSIILSNFPYDSQILDEWIYAVVPQIFDIEVKVQEKVLDSLKDLVINKIKNYSMYVHNASDSLPWRILIKLTDMKMRKHLSRACKCWVKDDIIRKSFIKNVQSHIGTDNDVAAWVLLVAISENMNLPDIDKYIDNYKEIVIRNNFRTSLILQILQNCWSSLDQTILKDIYKYLYECLCDFKINFGLISTCLDIIDKIVQYLYYNNSINEMYSNMENLINISETEIQQILEADNRITVSISNFLKAMLTLGHASFFCNRQLSPITLRILEGLLLQWESLPNSIKDARELQPSAIIVLGQQAMRDREIAQEVIPILGRLLRQNINQESQVDTAIKINAAKALADLCVRFTALVEPYLSDMCLGMKDPSPTVREAIIVIFIQLLLEDFVKVKGPFFFHILSMLSDPNETIRELTVFLVEERLLTKNKMLVSQQFLESIYHYNNYESQHKFYMQRMRKRDKQMLTFPGDKNQQNRRIIYDFMLEHLDPPGKIKLLVKITSQILGGIYSDTIDIMDQKGACVLKDALYILTNERLQPAIFSPKNDDEHQEHEVVNHVNILPTNAINVIVEGMKKYGLEVLLPMLIKLKKKFVILKSPLENDIMIPLNKIYNDYNKDQLTSLLHDYPEIEQEIEHYRKNSKKIMDTSNEDFEENLSPLPNTPKDLDSSIWARVPRIVLHRYSFTPITANSASSSQCSNNNVQLQLSDSFHKQSCITTTNFNVCENSFPEPGPSTSTPILSNFGNLDKNYRQVRTPQARQLFNLSYYENTESNNLISDSDSD